MERILDKRELSVDPESGPAYTRPRLILCDRQDAITGYEDTYVLLPHYPRATLAILEVARHNLQLEQPELLGVLVRDWLQRVASELAAEAGDDQPATGGQGAAFS
ncbi:alpha/beta fold hydrolase [Kribbella sp. VKM Ac-2566]|uniref:alpha/beta fold hydrolase n=1 Tax=Kribbella sp. VKM Ac-2566 TaxID=2512218 RepID=UPI0010627DF5|nr:alpha/beta hydrolase [Kribbella sp. VKM Ac-2566]